jgi:hypothetical protein
MLKNEIKKNQFKKLVKVKKIVIKIISTKSDREKKIKEG